MLNSICELSALLLMYDAKSWLLDINLRIQCAFAIPFVVFVPIFTVRNVNKNYERNGKNSQILPTTVAEWNAWLPRMQQSLVLSLVRRTRNLCLLHPILSPLSLFNNISELSALLLKSSLLCKQIFYILVYTSLFKYSSTLSWKLFRHFTWLPTLAFNGLYSLSCDVCRSSVSR